MLLSLLALSGLLNLLLLYLIRRMHYANHRLSHGLGLMLVSRGHRRRAQKRTETALSYITPAQKSSRR